MKKKEQVKLAVVGSRPAVGKSTLIRSFSMQSTEVEDLQIQ
jgi:predicted GTPase